MEKLSFSDILSSATMNLSSSTSLPFSLILINLTVSLFIGIIIALVYRKAFVGILFQKSFAISLILIAMVTTMIIMVISGNLILSLGMVGALSIVRFRAAIKDPIDIVYMFWAVGIGIANGVGFYSISVISSIFISIILIYLTRFPSKPQSKLVVIKGPLKLSNNVSSFIEKNGKRNVFQKSFSNNNLTFELVYEMQDREKIDKLFHSLNSNFKGIETRILSYTSN